MNTETYIRAVLECNFAGFKDEVIETAVKRIMEHVDKNEPKHGRWLPYEFGNERWHKCSVCGVADEYINSFGLEAIRNYCPNCGARMDGGEND